MKLAMAQMQMSDSTAENLQKTLRYMQQAKTAGADLIFFPEIQLSPFFPQYEKLDASRWLLQPDGPEIIAIRAACQELQLWASPNVYLELDGQCYDASLMIDAEGVIRGISKMVHIAQAPGFYEQDYYVPAPDGFQVYETPFGKIGVVICFDRHIPTSVRARARQGAELILVPTANVTKEPLELFAWEMRVQAFQNVSYIAMCNRVGPEGEATFAGQSLVAGPGGELLYLADGAEQLIVHNIPLEAVASVRIERPWLSFNI